MTDNNGLDVLIACSIFVALLLVLAGFVLHAHHDPLDTVERARDDDTR